MFSISYNEIDPFVTAQGNIVMKNIHGDAWNGDLSVLAVVRALLFERLAADETFFVDIHDGPTVDHVQNLKAPECFRTIFGEPMLNTYKVVNVNTATFDAANGILNTKAVKELTDYQLTELTEVSNWLRDREEVHLKTRIFLSADKGAAYILVEKLTTNYLHLISSLMPKYLPRFFTQKPLQPHEREFLKTLTGHRGGDFIAACAKVATYMDLREAFLRGIIGDFEQRELEKNYENARTRLGELQFEIQAAMEKYSQAIQREQDQRYRVEGMKLAMENKESNSELLEYLLHNKNVDVVRVNGNRIDFEIRTFMDIFDVDMWRHYAANGSVYTPGGSMPGPFKEEANRRLLIDSLFMEDAPLRLKFCGYYYMDLNGSCGSDRHHTYKPVCNDYLVNPHLHYHACLGSNRNVISQQLTNGELVGAIECAIASCKSLNMGEISQTVRPMLALVLESNKKIIRNADGVDMTPAEALEWLKQRDKKE